MKNTDMAFDDTALEQQIRASLSEYRVDGQDFADKVRERIREDGAGGGDSFDLGGGNPSEGQGSPATSFMRRAAGVLPPFLFPKGMAKFGVGTGSAGMTKAGLKFAPGLAMLPIALVLMTVVTAFMGLRSLTSGKGRQTHDHKRAMDAVKDWWMRNVISTVLVFAILSYLLFEAPTEAMVLLLLASTLTMIAIVGVLSGKGLAVRAELASRFASMILMLLVYVFQFVGAKGELAGPVGTGYAVPVLAVGTSILLSFGMKKRDGTLLKASPRRGLISLTLIAVGVAAFGQLGKVEVEVEHVVEWIEESEDAELAQPSRWYELQAAMDHLHAAGVPAIDLHNWKLDVFRVLDSALAGGEFNSLYALPVLRLGLERVQDRESWLGEYDRKDMVALEDGDFSFRSDEISLLAYDRLFELTEDQKTRIAKRILDSLPEPGAYKGLRDLVGARHMLETLGCKDQDGRLERVAQKMLLANWTPNNAGSQAAFPGSPDLQERDANGELDEKRLTLVWISSTSDAVMAMAHFGVPVGIDLLLLEGYLKAQAHGYSFGGVDTYSALAASSLAHLRSLDEFKAQVRAMPGPTLLGLAVKHRLLLASILLVTFAIGATLRAPVQQAGRVSSC
ncbi:MAG: hypothetical protein ACI8Q9_000419 [Planctomycetota bacterium]|jgi:hypothetical protein